MDDTHLSQRERECLTHLASGQRSPHIAKLMGITLSTVEFHIKGIKKKLNEHPLFNANDLKQLNVNIDEQQNETREFDKELPTSSVSEHINAFRGTCGHIRNDGYLGYHGSMGIMAPIPFSP